MSGRARFTPTPGLDQLVAKMIAPAVQDFVHDVEREAKRQAPPTKKWRSMRDVYVRKTHREIDGEEVPDNLLFAVTAYQWDLQHPGAMPVATQRSGGAHSLHDSPTVPGVYDYMEGPRDPSAGYVQVIHCRCVLEIDPEGVAKMVHSTRVSVAGTKVSGTVYAKGKYVFPAEYGDVYPGGKVAQGTFFMHKTVGIMAARGIG